ncbi:MAG: hypothetical protein ACI8TQ_001188 [Planctomycetota bacterium]|jgi:hypothetical protein
MRLNPLKLKLLIAWAVLSSLVAAQSLAVRNPSP